MDGGGDGEEENLFLQIIKEKKYNNHSYKQITRKQNKYCCISCGTCFHKILRFYYAL